MPIVCPHCTTSYAIDPANLGAAGRTVRCSRCKEVWLARPEDAVEIAAPAMAQAGRQASNADAAAEWEAMAREDGGSDTPVVDSPSISADWPAEGDASTDWASAARNDAEDAASEQPQRRSWFRKLFARQGAYHAPGKPSISLTTACAAMGALVLALTIWRVDVVRLLPQTAAFYKMVGLEVNLRGLMFKDVKITSETVEGKPVLVIEGVITGEGRKPVDLPRLRFSVRDAQGAEIYAWNAVLEQSVLKPGERAWFKSRLASPPPEGRNIDVRFFNRRDIAGGHA
ncbi:zinc-ribbon domain-containing protein [Bradyrhizobium sediminis]|uniref:Zinc-ribbon domain-containing protein n=1 Tax=Bradyrhizobium sediminis TaxID=2840469 RepID=A0A975NF65_9BRAD|nr:MJ0042-type zinc finger domain-containing protein [Bradyrhizobium sediminis]QWG14003.1 zinc-ribbon domain-containing protein [Bradyrhizobium sediminis]